MRPIDYMEKCSQCCLGLFLSLIILSNNMSNNTDSKSKQQQKQQQPKENHRTLTSPDNSKSKDKNKSIRFKRSRSLSKMRYSTRGGSLTSLPLFGETTDLAAAVSTPSSVMSDSDIIIPKATKTNYEIRPMDMGDLTNVFRLGNSVFTANEFPNLYRTWDDFSVVECFEKSPDFCLVAMSLKEDAQDSADQMIGFLLGHVMEKPNVEKRGYIEWVAIHPNFRRMGTATTLLHMFASKANEMGILRLFADTQSDNLPAKALLTKAGLTYVTDHVYMTHHVSKSKAGTSKRIDAQGWLEYTFSAVAKPVPGEKDETTPMPRTRASGRKNHAKKTVKITIRPMEIHDLHSIWLMGERIFPQSSPNLFHFWDQHLVLQSYLSDPEFCLVATVPAEPANSTTDLTSRDLSMRKSKRHKKGDSHVERNHDEQVIGFCFGTTIEKPRSRWKYGYLVWLGTSPEYQGLGVASELYNSMKELFVRDHCSILMIDTQSSNAPAIAFFRKKGFGQDEKHIYLSNEAGAFVPGPRSN